MTAGDRQINVGSLDADIGRHSITQDVADLAHRLQNVGVPATKSASIADVIGDELLRERGTYRFVSDHREGQRPVLAASWRLSRAPVVIERGAPKLGEVNDYVLGELVGADHRPAATS